MTEKKYKGFSDAPVANMNALRQIKSQAPSSPSITSIPSTSSRPRTTSTPIAPERDFQRVPNSVTKKAMAGGLFRGKSKQVWDYLWSVSRAAITPTRSVRKSRKEIKAGSGLGSMVTVDAAIEHLQSVGLIAIKPSIGSLLGNEYEVFTPEEASTSTTSISSTTSLTQNLDNLDILDSSISSTTQTIDSITSSGLPNTFFNTRPENDDDEAFAGFIQTFDKAAREVTGKGLSPTDNQRLTDLAELLVTELRIAAARTTVSNAPAFLTEHLRRRLWKKDKQTMSEEKATPEHAASSPLLSRLKPEEIKACPDCGGTGFYYPTGYEGGVAKCRHQTLLSSTDTQPLEQG